MRNLMITLAAVLLAISQVGAQTEVSSTKRDFEVPVYRHFRATEDMYNAFAFAYISERRDTTHPQCSIFWDIMYDSYTDIYFVSLGSVEFGIYGANLDNKRVYWVFVANYTKFLNEDLEGKTDEYFCLIPKHIKGDPLNWILNYAKKNVLEEDYEIKNGDVIDRIRYAYNLVGKK